MTERVLAEIRHQVEVQLPKREADVAALATELRELRAERERLAKAVALADDVSELRQRSARIQQKTPDELGKLVKQSKKTARAKLADLRAALADESDRREVFLALFPDGLTFAPTWTPDGSVRSGTSPARWISDH